ncbi:hypothetical protein TYRP_006958 [Tyrophagus putrescentiae]|nr:hypothetical protein TYRP_006958 [Tyrophagus putrescentiae]
MITQRLPLPPPPAKTASQPRQPQSGWNSELQWRRLQLGGGGGIIISVLALAPNGSTTTTVTQSKKKKYGHCQSSLEIKSNDFAETCSSKMLFKSRRKNGIELFGQQEEKKLPKRISTIRRSIVHEARSIAIAITAIRT